jgi:uncharacterized protein YjhX (UPF0386 family)
MKFSKPQQFVLDKLAKGFELIEYRDRTVYLIKGGSNIKQIRVHVATFNFLMSNKLIKYVPGRLTWIQASHSEEGQ